MKADNIFNVVITTGAIPTLKVAGFTKSNLNFHRRRGSVVQVVNFQRSLHNTSDDRIFYINVGVAFDELWQLQGIDLNSPMHKRFQKPLEQECHFRSRLETLIPNCPKWWVISGNDVNLFRETSLTNGREIATNGEDAIEVAKFLAECLAQATLQLDQIDSSKAFLAHPWKDVPGNQGVTQLLISKGND